MRISPLRSGSDEERALKTIQKPGLIPAILHHKNRLARGAGRNKAKETARLLPTEDNRSGHALVDVLERDPPQMGHKECLQAKN
jgi:hypothetical protein